MLDRTKKRSLNLKMMSQPHRVEKINKVGRLLIREKKKKPMFIKLVLFNKISLINRILSLNKRYGV